MSDMNVINDLEIYAKKTTLEDIERWLALYFEQVTVIRKGKTVHTIEIVDHGHIIPVMVVERAVGKAWTSIWFKSRVSLWDSDAACAVAINSVNKCRVRFSAKLWQQGEDMDEWQQIDEKGQLTTIQWPNQDS